MERVVKFRGKVVNHDPMTNPENGWVEGYYLQDLDNGVVKHYIFNCPMKWEVNADTVGQFTGYFDNDGNEIYEGDVIQVLHSFSLSFGAKHNRKIRGAYDEEWSKTDWGEDAVTYFRNYRIELGKRDYWIGRNGSVQHPLRSLSGFLIGNIHDNPTLLTDGRD